MKMIIKNKATDDTIINVDDWKRICPPKDPEKQWVAFRSAKELANFWVGVNKEENIRTFCSLLKKNGIQFDYKNAIAYPECALKFDDYDNPRQNDLVIIDHSNSLFISVEAKSDEEFGGNYIPIAIKNAEKAVEKNPYSNAFKRIDGLKKNYFNNQNIDKLRYQLTYWFAGSINFPDVSKVIMLNHVFTSQITKEEKLRNNALDYNTFAKLITKSEIEIAANQLVGPISNEYTRGKQLYIGKLVTELD